MPTDKNLTCFCGKTFKYSYTKHKHIRNVHKIETEAMRNTRKVYLKCPLCTNTSSTYHLLREHLSDSHDIPIVKEEFTFKGFQEFLSWKKSYEKQENKYYIKKSRPTKTKYGGVKTYYYYCYRSGNFISKSNNIRRPRREGSRKMNVSCPSTLIAKEYKKTIYVTFWTTHIGHTEDLSDVTISKEERAVIISKLRKGIPMKSVLSSLRNLDSCHGELRNVELSSLEEILSISKIIWTQNQERKHENELMSVKLWIEEMCQLGPHSPVIYFKQQDEIDLENLFNKEDSALILMTPFQKELLIKLGCKKICVDVIQKSKSYDFKLVTLIVIDEFGSGFPVAYYVSNRIDETAMKIFFYKIKNRIGNMQCEIFMSDEYPAFYNAWIAIVGKPSTKLLCTWAVDKEWRRNIISKIRGKSAFEIRLLVYKRLRALMCETNKENIVTLLNSFLTNLNNNRNTTEFLNYFTTYQHKINSWAYCYREQLGVSTNMSLESFHKVLKYIFLEGKVNKRLDKFISTLLLITKQKIYDRMIKFCKNKPPQKFKDIIESHKQSKNISNKLVYPLSTNMWQIVSPNNLQYIVTYAIESKCKNNCMISCSDCKICVHMYACTCMENTIKFNICNHIHACHKYFGLELIKLINAKDEVHLKEMHSTGITNLPSSNNFQNVLKQTLDILLNLTSQKTLSPAMQTNVIQKMNLIISDLDASKRNINQINRNTAQSHVVSIIKHNNCTLFSNLPVEKVQLITETLIKDNINHDHCYLK